MLLDELYAAVPRPKHNPIKITPEAVGTIRSPLRGHTSIQTTSLQRNFLRCFFAPGPDQSPPPRGTFNAERSTLNVKRSAAIERQ
jgi:hypothetical protein